MASLTARPVIEDYALIGDFRTAALVSRDGSVDWFCIPRFDSGAVFAKLVGEEQNGFWSLRPKAKFAAKRKYRPDTLILETDFETADGVVRITDCMLPTAQTPTIVRVVKCLSGKVAMNMELVARFEYGDVVPWVTKDPFGRVRVTAGPNTLSLKTTVPTYGEDLRTKADFEIKQGESVPFLLSWTPSHQNSPAEISDPEMQIERLAIWWQDWASRCDYEGPYKEIVKRSLITLKALTFVETGGIVAAPTTSLPEELGGIRNWDYRYCWIRDSTITLRALLSAGYREEALAWRDWLRRAVAGTPEQINIMYGLSGERRLTEAELPWLKGYQNSKPVRVGNGAYDQFQLDIYGVLMNSFLMGREHGLAYESSSWSIEKHIVEFLEKNWQNPDRGIWEVRGEDRHFTHSKMMAWVAMDRAIRSVKTFGCECADLAKWEKLAATIHADVCEKAFNPKLNSFVQSYGSDNLDASTLLMSAVDFLPASDPRMIGTVKAISENLMQQGFVRRYSNAQTEDGLTGSEGAFLPCSLWLAENYRLQGQVEKAQELFEKVVHLSNDVGLLSEEYDPVQKRFLGNFPQAFTHVAVVNGAYNLLGRPTASPAAPVAGHGSSC